MADTTSQFTSPVAVRSPTTTIAYGLISAVIGGSIVLTGNHYTDRTNNTAPSLVYGTGSYETYVDTNNGASTTVKCTNTGGLAKYTGCYVANPFTGTGIVKRVQYDAYKAPTGSKVTCTNTTIGSLTATGDTAYIKYATTASGYSLTASGAFIANNYKAQQVLPGAGIRCWFSSTPGPGILGQLRVWLVQQYVP